MQILLVDDHELIRAGLKDSLNKRYGPQDIFEASNSKEALAVLSQQNIDLALVDLFIPGEKVFSLLRSLCSNQPDLPVIVLSASENPAHVRKCIDLGAMGFASKSLPQPQLFEAIDKVTAGGLYIPEVSDSPAFEADSEIDPQLSYDDVRGILTDRQLQILTMMAQGKANKLIARHLNLSNYTIKAHVSAILRKLGLDNRTQAGILAEKLGLLASDDATMKIQ